MARRSGQAMLIAVLTLGGAILGATALAGLLTLYQVRSTTDSENSAKAIFAADSGLNWSLYSYFNPPEVATNTLSNGATYFVVCTDPDDDTVIACDKAPSSTVVLAEGISNGSRRAFASNLTDATSTLP